MRVAAPRSREVGLREPDELDIDRFIDFDVNSPI